MLKMPLCLLEQTNSEHCVPPWSEAQLSLSPLIMVNLEIGTMALHRRHIKTTLPASDQLIVAQAQSLLRRRSFRKR